MDFTVQEIVIRLVAATVLSGLIGMEREFRQKPAGIRTNALIGLGSALMTLAGLFIAEQWPDTTDPSRIASVVVQGIGFIGAGAIIQASGSIRGLTTAATMWVCAGIGILTGFGFYEAALISTIIVLVLLAVFGPLDAKLMGHEEGENGHVLKPKRTKRHSPR
ncbi:MAG: MgtC/SapB family protein [Patescibacteria group bacterium]